MRIIVIFVVTMIIFINGCDPRYGFMESQLKLAAESRLPKWFSVPPGYDRKDLSVTIDFYTAPSSTRVKMTLYGPPPECKKLDEKAGRSRWHPETEQKSGGKEGYAIFPSYTIISIDGLEEVFEQKRLENLLYVTDYPSITSGYRK
jgi:hypothetical protein